MKAVGIKIVNADRLKQQRERNWNESSIASGISLEQYVELFFEKKRVINKTAAKMPIRIRWCASKEQKLQWQRDDEFHLHGCCNSNIVKRCEFFSLLLFLSALLFMRSFDDDDDKTLSIVRIGDTFYFLH